MRPQDPTEPTAQAMYDASRKCRAARRRRRARAHDITHLNLTPMLDIMTILLVFLIKSAATSVENVNVADLRLPQSTRRLPAQAALQLLVTRDQILIGHRPVARLKDRRLQAGDLPGGPDSDLIQPLYDALRAKARDLKEIEAGGGARFLGRIAIIADEHTHYQTLFKVLHTAGRAEFGAFRLFVRAPPADADRSPTI